MTTRTMGRLHSAVLLISALACGSRMAVAAEAPKPPATPKAAPAAVPGYHELKRIPLDGDGGWDYLTADGDGRRLYVTHGTKVTVVDLDHDRVVGEIPNLSGVHGVALAPKLGRGFISNGKSSEVTIFDLATLKVIATVKSTGDNPDAILFDPASRRVFTFNGRSGNATVLDAATGAVAGTLPLGGKPEFATADGKGRVFVNLEDKSEVVAIDSTQLTVTARWPLAPCEEPTGMAIDLKHGRLLLGCGNKLAAVVDTRSGKVVGTPPIGAGVDAVAFDPATHTGFSSNGEGTLTVLTQDKAGQLTAKQTVPTERGARTMALDPKTHQVYLATARFNPAPAPTAEQPRPRPTPVPGSFFLLVLGP